MLNSTNEKWLPIKDYPMYRISSYGRVFSIRTNRILKYWLNNSGYCIIALKNKRFTIHKLVALHFLPNPDNLPQIDHIDNNKKNNHMDNLQWCSCSFNVTKSYKENRHNLEKHKSYIGRKHAKSTTKYYNVSRIVEWNKTRTKSYTYYKGSIAHNGKVLSPKKFKTQEEAALYVNYLIDKYKLDRPKNIVDKCPTTIL